MKEVQVLDKKFRELIPEEALQQRISEMAKQMSGDYRGREVVFIGILNGAFMFASDLFRKVELDARISFIKLASYQGTGSSGTVKELIGWNEELKGREIIVLEDIVDTGCTLEHTVNNLVIRKVAGIRVAAMLLKPEAYKKSIPVDYVGFEIPNNFVVGYGLDYNGFGRNLTSIYSLIQ